MRQDRAPRHTEDDPLRVVEPSPRPIEHTPDDAELASLYAHPEGAVRLGLIRSSDGLSEAPGGGSRGLGGQADLRVLRILRAAADVVLVGGASAQREHYAPVHLPRALQDARVASGRPANPRLAVVTRSGKLPETLPPGSAIIVTAEDSPAARQYGAEFPDTLALVPDGGFDPAAAIAALRAMGLSRVLCEGGPIVATILLEAGLVDDYCLTTSPHAGDPDAAAVPPVPTGYERTLRLTAGPYVMERWQRPDSASD